MTEAYAVQVNPTIGGVLWNIRGGTAGEFKESLDFLAENASDIQDALAVIQQAGLANQVNVSLPKETVNPGSPPPGGAAPMCKNGHGPMKDLSGKTTKSGAAYRHKFYCNDFNCRETAD